jgi:multiple sugar transport system substrate-binding protein
LRRQISRREFLARTAAMGLTLPSLSALLAACVTAPPQTVEKVVTVEVEKEVQVEKIVTVEVEKEGAALSNSSAAIAEAIAKEKYAGETLNVTWESGLQAQDPLIFSGPEFEKRTGVKINVIEVGVGSEMFAKQLTEHVAGTGAFDVLQVQPSWTADYVFAGVIAPLDDFVEQYLNKSDLDDLTDLYKGMANFDGKIYGIFDDGDTLLLYYRTDLFEEHGAEFADTVGHPLGPPTTWKEFDEIARFFTEKLSPDVYGAAFGRAFGWNWQVFIPHFKANGGTFFDPETMTPLINGPEGLRTISEMKASNQWMPPGIEQLGAIETFQEWLAGKYAMTYFWPPLGRWSAGYGQQTAQLSFLPPSQVTGKVGYALFPGDITQMAAGFNLAVSADSPRPELAYLFIQWLTSPEISLQRVMLPYALRDPYRISHFESTLYRNLWPESGQYLDKLLEAGGKASLDIFMPGSQEYQDALDRACTATYAGTDPQAALDTAAQEFEEITERLGRDQQKQAYANYIQMAGSYPSANLVDAPSNLELYE